MEYKTIRHTTDILAIGGGIGGLVSGIMATKQQPVAVVVPAAQATVYSLSRKIKKWLTVMWNTMCGISENILKTRKELLPQMKVDSYHDLKVAHEVSAMAEVAEMVLRAAIIRKESRGTHIRQDYSEIDNENWLKWIIIENDNGEMKLSTQDIPIEKYPYRPDNA